jgi:O-methyltransferase involved in polyketide biosynthesis
LLQGLSIKNILELSSGFSFRGLATIQQNDFHYIDTDLPNIIITKKGFLSKIEKNNVNPKGKLEIIPLNALDEKQFTDTVTHFPAGEIFIVNEGLLVYLNTEEKEKLCSIIHTILKLRGGYWITADIYIKTRTGKSSLIADDNLKQFLEQHRIEDNKFDSFEAAEAFFKKAGFVVDKEARPDHLKLSSLQHLLKSMTEKQIAEMRNTPKFRATWRLKIASV